MILTEFRPVRRSALRGFATVRLPSGLTIADGRHVEEGGRRKYAPILSWPDRATADRLSAAVVDLVRLQHPAALP
jgi:hypothetical protein